MLIDLGETITLLRGSRAVEGALLVVGFRYKE